MNSTPQWLQAIGVGVGRRFARLGAASGFDHVARSRERHRLRAAGPAAEATAGGQRIDGAFVLRGARRRDPGRADAGAAGTLRGHRPATRDPGHEHRRARQRRPPVEARASGNDMASPRPRDAGMLLVAIAASTSPSTSASA